MAVDALRSGGKAIEDLKAARCGYSQEGYSAVRKFFVAGLEAVTDLSSRLLVASQSSGIPRYGDPYPFNGTNLPATIICISVEAEFMEACTTKAYVTCQYKRLSGGNQKPAPKQKADKTGIFFSGTTNSVKQFVDKDGNQMILNWTSGDAPKTIYHPDQPVEFDRLKAQLHLTIRRISDNTYPDDYINVLGKVNSVTWVSTTLIFTLNGPRTWLCVAADTSPKDLGVVEEVYKFIYRGETWDQEAVYKDPATGAAINLGGAFPFKKDGTPAVSRKTFKIYQEVDFNTLNLL